MPTGLYGTAQKWPSFVEEIRSHFPALIEEAEAVNDLPELFNGGAEYGDLPAETASGIAPASLAELGWRSKLVVSHISGRAAAVDLLERFAAPDGEDYAVDHFGTNDRVADHMRDVWDAIRARVGDTKAYEDALYKETFVKQSRVMASSAGNGEFPEYEALYGRRTGATVTATAGGEDEYNKLFGPVSRVVQAGTEDEALYRAVFGTASR